MSASQCLVCGNPISPDDGIWRDYKSKLPYNKRAQLLSKRQYLFDQSTCDRMWLTMESGFSVTPHEKAIIIARKMMQTTRNIRFHTSVVGGDNCCISITDGTANVGGDTMALMKFFQTVVAIELDSTTFNFLEHNLSVAMRYHTNNTVTSLNLVHGSVVEAVLKQRIETDALFLDPPWGGTDYKNDQHVHLRLGDFSVSEVTYSALYLNPKLLVVFIKAPFNFDSTELEQMAKKSGFSLSSQKIQRKGYNLLKPLFVLWTVHR